MTRSLVGLSKEVEQVTERGFTLVEVLVATAIMAIMSAIMVPMFYKVWESNEKAETRGRMDEVKRAMVGDQKMVQNGIRMHYGFVGDNGTLPDAITDLVANSGAFANWNGPYLVGAFDPAEFAKDAWGHGLVYTRHNPPLLSGGQQITATLTSVGPDGISGTTDDLNENSDPALQILVSEVWPTDTVRGNLNYVFSAASGDPGKTFFADIQAVYADPTTGTTMANPPPCIPVSTGVVPIGIPKSMTQAFSVSFASGPLPVGQVYLRSRLYSNNICTTAFVPDVVSNELSTFVSDGLSAVSVNMPTVYYSLN